MHREIFNSERRYMSNQRVRFTNKGRTAPCSAVSYRQNAVVQAGNQNNFADILLYSIAFAPVTCANAMLYNKIYASPTPTVSSISTLEEIHLESRLTMLRNIAFFYFYLEYQRSFCSTNDIGLCISFLSGVLCPLHF